MIPKRILTQSRILSTFSPASTFARRTYSASMTELQRQRLVVTRTLPQASQARLDKGFEGIDVVQWKEDCAIPRSELLRMAKGADGILCLLTDKIDAEVLDAAGKR